ncbi:MAG TPA: hypothetical protein DEO40_04800 [Treponema sp.]|nr:hypothetical protein [Treponema sp.]
MENKNPAVNPNKTVANSLKIFFIATTSRKIIIAPMIKYGAQKKLFILSFSSVNHQDILKKSLSTAFPQISYT